MAKSKIERVPLARDRWDPRNEEWLIPIKADMTDAIQDTFVEYLQEGNPIDVCCDLVGISYDMYSKWMRRGRVYFDALLDGTADPADEQYYRWYRAVTRAVATWKRNKVIELQDSNSSNPWQKSLAILARRDTRNWGKDTYSGFDTEDQIEPDETFL